MRLLSPGRTLFFMLLFTLPGWMTGCEKSLGLRQPTTDPLSVFNEVWMVMDQRYALFRIKGVDWTAMQQEYRARISGGMTDKELFRVVDEMLETLKDGHVTLISPSDTATYQGFYELYPKNFNYDNLIKNYLHSDYKTLGPVIYKIQNNVGYLYYRSFAVDISDVQTDQLFSDLKDTKGLIMDFRSNPGGNSSNADRIFQRLIQAKSLVKYEQSKKGTGHDDYFDPKPYYLVPAGPTYKSPIYVLTNRSCFSACNDLILYLSELPTVKIVGDQTGGGGGIPQDYILANGWKLQYTSTMTLSPGKLSIENGILPNLPIGISSLDEARGIDSIIETAYRLLQ